VIPLPKHRSNAEIARFAPEACDPSRPNTAARVETTTRNPSETTTPADEVCAAIARLLGRQAAREWFGAEGETPTTSTKASDAVYQAGAAVNPICHRLFSIDQAAEFAGVPARLILRWIKTRKLEAYDLEGGIRIDEVELADCISSWAPKRP
jgi:hypothetical protein